MYTFGYESPVGILFTIGEPKSQLITQYVSVPEASAEGTAEAQKRSKTSPVDYRALGLSEEHIPELIRLATDGGLYLGDTNQEEDQEEDQDEELSEDTVNAGWHGVVHAWFALAQLNAQEAAEPLLHFLRYVSQDDYDEWASELLPQILAFIGPHLIPALTLELKDSHTPEYYRMNMATTIAGIGRHHGKREECIQVLSDELARYLSYRRDVNAALVSSLLDLKATETIDVLREAYRREIVPLSFAGDIESVEIALGLRTERSTPARNWIAEEYDFGQQEDDDLLEAGKHEPEGARTPVVRSEPKVGRNDPCPCGSGKKYKKCCMA